MNHEEDTGYRFIVIVSVFLIAIWIWLISGAEARTYNLEEDCNYDNTPQSQIYEKIVSCIERMNKDVQELRTNSGNLAELMKQDDYLR